MKIAIFGTVGAGKTSISEKISDALGFEIFNEPITKTNPYFQHLYSEPDVVYKMEIYMLSARFKQLNEAKQIKNVIFDRSIIEAPIFVELNHYLNNIDNNDYNTFISYYNKIILPYLSNPQTGIQFDIIFYLSVSTDKAIERIKTRGREAELNVEYSFWQKMNECYNDFYDKNKNNYPFYKIDVNSDNLEEKANEIINIIKQLKYNKGEH